MNINFIKLKSVIHELKGIRIALERLADAEEMKLIDQGFIVRPSQGKAPESMDYVNEEEDWARETFEFIRNREKQDEEENIP